MNLDISIKFICNRDLVTTSINPATTVLDFIRKHLHLAGTKEACREGDCGACTILIGEIIEGELKYKIVNSCLLPIGKINGKHIVTIEGLNGKELNLIQNFIVDEGGTQCGFCTPGFIISMTGYFLNAQQFNIDNLIKSLDGNICRCTGYSSIIRAAHDTIDSLKKENNNNNLEFLVERKILPEYFLQIPDRLKNLEAEIENFEEEKGNSPIIISGGTDLFVQKPDEILDNSVSFLLKNKQNKIIWDENNVCFIHASATISDIKDSILLKKFFPNIDNFFSLFGSLQIRNSATIGGNIVNASPIGDSTIFFLTLNSKLHLKSIGSSREVMLKDFFQDYKNLDLKDVERLEYLSFDLPKDKFFFNFEKVSRRTILDIASVNSAVFLTMNGNLVKDINISAGGVSPVPMLLEKTAAFLRGKEISEENILAASSVAQSEVSPIDDVRGSAAYKKLLLRQILFSHFLKMFPEKVNVEELV